MLNRKSVILVILLVLFLLCPASVMALTGGPDAGGYSFYDSKEQSAEAFSWTEIGSRDGIGITKTAWDARPSQKIAVEIPFYFNFYGKSYKHVYISHYGFLSFNSGGEPDFLFYGIAPIPTGGGASDNLIAGLWGNLLPGT